RARERRLDRARARALAGRLARLPRGRAPRRSAAPRGPRLDAAQARPGSRRVRGRVARRAGRARRLPRPARPAARRAPRVGARLGAVAVLAGVLTQACGHALVEDTAFRGFFLPELRARLARPASIFAGALLVALAIFGSALLFGLAHLPTRAFAKGSDAAAL